MTQRNVLPGGALAVGAVVVLLALGACATPAEPGKATLTGAETTAAETRGGAESTQPEIGPAPTAGETPVGGRPWDSAASEACQAALGQQHTQTAQSSDGTGVTSFWTSGNRGVVCDVAGDEAPISIETGKPRAGFDEAALAVTTTALSSGSEPAVRFVAGGRLPWPVQEISYTFPDGHTETARFVAGEDDPDVTWWAVTYTATEGPLVDPSTSAADLDPVTISIVGAAAEAYRLPWEEAQRSE